MRLLRCILRESDEKRELRLLKELEIARLLAANGVEIRKLKAFVASLHVFAEQAQSRLPPEGTETNDCK